MLSPLRYPGGKAKLFPYFVEIISKNNLYGRTYAEPYAGGAGLALKLLSHGYVRNVELNDIDPAIAAFWHSVLNDADAICSLIRSIPVTVEEWWRQKAIYAEGENSGILALGFAAYFLNRTSRSGIIEGSGPIGGFAQAGDWSIDARFNRKAQEAQVADIARYSSDIRITKLDALDFAREKIGNDAHFTYLDPPYYVKGKKLYKNFYNHDEHLRIASLLNSKIDGGWILSYDYAPEIVSMYPAFTPTVYNLQYSAGAVGKGKEVIFSGRGINLPYMEGFRQAA